jgi:NTP pyrophosphatase (non-canonical NTP hydrolase)
MDRDWEQFHTPKNLAMALVCEAAELAEIFQWLTPDQSREVMSNGLLAASIVQELADVQIYLLRMADVLHVDLESAVKNKVAMNSEKYPIEIAKGNAVKYSRRGE